MSTSATQVESTIGHLVKALKTPTIGRVYADLATWPRPPGRWDGHTRSASRRCWIGRSLTEKPTGRPCGWQEPTSPG
jgi:hypothetical protein